MKRIIALLFCATALSVQAQVHHSQQMLQASALYVTNVFWTNIASGFSAYGTNTSSHIWTNRTTGLRVSGTNTTLQNFNVFAPANLWVDRNGNSVTGATSTNAGLLVKFVGIGANATNQLTITLAPLPNGTTELTNTLGKTLTSSAAALIPQALWFPIQNSDWVGCQKFIIQRVYTVAPVAPGSDFYITSIEFCGFQP